MNDNTSQPAPRDLNIVEPCPKSWGELEGAGTRRFCDQCSLHVVDGSALTQEEAKALVTETSERVCMRLVKDENGKIVHAEAAPKPRAVDRLLRYGLTAVAGVLAACGDDRKAPGDTGSGSGTGSPTDPAPGDTGERPPEIMGEVCYPEEMGAVEVQHEEFMGLVAPGSVEEEVEPPATEPREMLGRVAQDPAPTTEETPDD